MSVTAASKALALSTVIAATMDSITVISLKTAAGELFRKIPTEVDEISPQKKQFTFWISDTEGNGNLTGLSLYGNGATTTLGTGTEMVAQAVTIKKDNTNSLTVIWTVEVTQ
ncbi:hypothetical protein [Desulfosporosinus nitroreducens]|uniref:hypothetical protein n=1 Tax=Desulfosporosinus nitroreducens TaxID=2018668 RepID=UPI00207CEA42|nr:hypothetical protein [Desulfosporosinus nitroreducens]MCO1599750.1 hypothetical protein [Desulfosporosinus nitroreducens]